MTDCDKSYAAESIMNRNPAIECYRVILMLLIVLSHSAGRGLWANDTKYRVLCLLYSSLFIWHVDGFLSITGWFGTRFSLTRFAKTWGVIAFYSIFSVAYGWWMQGHHVGRYLAGGWFGQTYLYFLLIVPFLNSAISWVESCDRNKFFFIWLLFDLAIILNRMPYSCFTGVTGSGTDSCSIMTFIAVYVNARFLRISGLAELYSVRIISIALGLFLLGFGLHAWAGGVLGYESPCVILAGLAGLLCFARYVSIPAWMGRFVSIVSPLTFGIYVLHDTTSFGRLTYLIPQLLMSDLGWSPLVIVPISALFCFILCAGVEIARHYFASILCRNVLGRIRSVDSKLNSKLGRMP